MYPDPPGNYVWQPSMSDKHANAAVANFEGTVERAKQLRSQVDLDSVDEGTRFHLRGSSTGSHLDATKEEQDVRERLFSVTYGILLADEAVSYAEVTLGEGDPDAHLGCDHELWKVSDAVTGSISAHRISNPGRDLGYLYAIEHQLIFVRISSSWNGTSIGGDPDSINEYSLHGLANTWGSQLQAGQRLEDARYYREQYRSGLGDDPQPHRERLDDVLLSLLTEIDRFSGRGQIRTKLEDEPELDQSSPYGTARWELYMLYFDDDSKFYGNGLRRDLAILHVMRTGQALLVRQAREYALKELDVTPADIGYDSGRALRTKCRSMRSFRATRDEYDSNFAGVIADEATNVIRAGDMSLETGDGPAWKERVGPTVYYLVGAGIIREFGSVVGPVVSLDAN